MSQEKVCNDNVVLLPGKKVCLVGLTFLLLLVARDDSGTHAPFLVPCAHASDDAETSGVKSAAVKAATKILAKAIREGGKYASWIVAKLDAKAANVFRTYAKKIAKQLDDIAEIPDLTLHIVKEKTFVFLNSTLRLDGGTSLMIADAVKAVLDVLVL